MLTTHESDRSECEKLEIKFRLALVFLKVLYHLILIIIFLLG
jgi:hypothetical protein